MYISWRTAIGGADWRLSGLWRGRRGTEWAIGGQQAGDRFVLIGARTLLTLPLATGAIGSAVRLLAEGPGDAGVAVQAGTTIDGRSLVPPAPVHLRLIEQPDGAALLRWVRRSRSGWDWLDAVDAPLGEERERYRVTITQADGATWTAETEVPELALTAAQHAGATQAAVRQIGDHGVSRAALLALPQEGDA
jgi:hypothetical protein